MLNHNGGYMTMHLIMKHLRVSVALVLLFATAAACTAEPPTNVSTEVRQAPAKVRQVPVEVRQLWNELRIAILEGDPEGVSAISHYPIRSLDDSFDKIKDPAALEKSYSKIFDDKLVDLVLTNQVTLGPGEPGFEVECGEGYMIFGFERFGDGYKLSYLGSINE
jgi:hypothetical protein